MNRTLTVVLLPAVVLAAGATSQSHAASAKPKTRLAEPKLGVTTPGVQLPFSSVKAEVDLPAPAKPEWLFFSESVFVPARDHIDRIDVKSNKAADPITGLDKPCGGMASGFGSVWAPLCGTPGLARIDAKTYKVTKTINTGVSSARGVIAASTDSIWLLTDDKTTLARIDPDQNAVVAEIRLPAGCHSLVFGETALWIACPEKNRVLRLNAATNLIEKQIDVSAEPESIAVGSSSIWVLCKSEGKIDRIDPKTNKVTRTIELNVPKAEGALAFGEGFLWATMTGFPLTRIEIDAETVTVTQQFHGPGGGAFALAPGAIWLSNLESATLWRVDPKRVRAILPE
jgi:virginiamycin B lyase